MSKFVTPQISKLLKARGFNDPCIAYYTEVTERLCPPISDKPLINEFIEVTHKEIYETYSLAPTWEDAFIWLRKNHIHVNFSPRSWTHENGVHIIKWSFWADALDIWMCNLSIDDRHTDDPYDTYEEAREKALLGAIELFDKLPEIREKLKSL